MPFNFSLHSTIKCVIFFQDDNLFKLSNCILACCNQVGLFFRDKVFTILWFTQDNFSPIILHVPLLLKWEIWIDGSNPVSNNAQVPPCTSGHTVLLKAHHHTLWAHCSAPLTVLGAMINWFTKWAPKKSVGRDKHPLTAALLISGFIWNAF